jgi:hypothetical protein
MADIDGHNDVPPGLVESVPETVSADGVPAVIDFGCIDAYAEEQYFSIGSALVGRGYAVLLLNGPGQGPRSSVASMAGSTSRSLPQRQLTTSKHSPGLTVGALTSLGRASADISPPVLLHSNIASRRPSLGLDGRIFRARSHFGR